MNKSSSKVLTGFKYIYLVAFFALLAGFFHPLITDTSFDVVVFGVIVLFIGLAGGILLYKSATSENKKGTLLAGGFILMFASIGLFSIFDLFKTEKSEAIRF